MKTTSALLALVLATPAAAHSMGGAHLHPHPDPLVLVVVAGVLGLVAVSLLRSRR